MLFYRELKKNIRVGFFFCTDTLRSPSMKTVFINICFGNNLKIAVPSCGAEMHQKFIIKLDLDFTLNDM